MTLGNPTNPQPSKTYLDLPNDTIVMEDPPHGLDPSTQNFPVYPDPSYPI